MYNIYVSFSEEPNYKYFAIITQNNHLIRGSHFNNIVQKLKYFRKKYPECEVTYDLKEEEESINKHNN